MVVGGRDMRLEAEKKLVKTLRQGRGHCRAFQRGGHGCMRLSKSDF